MIKLIRNNQKKALAFFGVLLMLTFLFNRGNGNDNQRTDREVGRLNGKAVTYADLAQAHAEVSALQHTAMMVDVGKAAPTIALYLGQAAANEVQTKPDLFYLLKEEARQAGMTVTPEEVDNVMKSDSFSGPPPGTEGYDAVREGMADLMMIQGRFMRVQNQVKISKPVLNNLLAEGQSISLDFVQLQASKYLPKVPAPTTQQLQTQFDAFKAIAPGHPEEPANPFGFGYRLPTRAKLQMIRISPLDLQNAVTARHTAYEWEKEARKYYLKNKDEFKSDTLPATTQQTVMVPGSFEASRSAVLEKIRKPLVDALQQEVASYVNTALSDGWQAYTQYANTPVNVKAPTSEPTTAVGEPFTSMRFMQKVADEVQSRFKVTASVDETAKFLSITEMSALSGLNDPKMSDFISQQFDLYQSSPDLNTPAAHAILLRPSPPMQANDSNPVVFLRVSELLAAQAAPDPATVQSAVEADYRTQASYALAKADADKLVDAASKGELYQAATTVGEAVHSTLSSSPLTMSAKPRMQDGKLVSKPLDVIEPPLDKPDMSDFEDIMQRRPPKMKPNEQAFAQSAFKMLETYDPKSQPHPVKVISFPTQQRLFVVQMTGVQAKWTTGDFYKTVLSLQSQAAQSVLQSVSQKWYDYDQVVKRLGYKSANAKSDS